MDGMDGMNGIHKIATPQEVAEELLASEERDVWFFKHSLTCGVSSAAHREFEKFVAATSGDEAPRFCIVEIQPAREASKALAEQLAVRHESPQAILVRKGRAAWHASHWSITSDALNAAAT